jgi:hypothetical protein
VRPASSQATSKITDMEASEMVAHGTKIKREHAGAPGASGLAHTVCPGGQCQRQVPGPGRPRPKAVSDPALEVADFIMHAVGRQARNRLKGQEGFVRHFAAVFHTVDAKLASFISVDRVEAISRT